MMHILICPHCGKTIKNVNCNGTAKVTSQIYLDENMDSHILSKYFYGENGPKEYICPLCKYSTSQVKDFIKIVNNECEHEITYEIDYNESEYNICHSCGLITSINNSDWL